MKGIVAVTVKLGIVHEYPLIRLSVPATIVEIFVDYHLLPGSKADSIVKTRNRFRAPPLVVKPPAIVNSFDALSSPLPDRQWKTFGVFLYLY